MKGQTCFNKFNKEQIAKFIDLHKGSRTIARTAKVAKLYSRNQSKLGKQVQAISPKRSIDPKSEACFPGVSAAGHLYSNILRLQTKNKLVYSSVFAGGPAELGMIERLE
ncbi:hypothetical protein HFO58_32015 [Rhizobium leguminosarum]|uniref:hypothetical protein n=1 Tax=Rhizobium leguminosarum TaxID=384 RepID=UPI001C98883E|nr:hypothetical protein [Rhizobium leguminosarum]MBY5537718.1 hypothetical protein [Rhizobium leguminosarum]